MWHKCHPDKPEPDLQEGQGRHAMYEFRCHHHLFCWQYIRELTFRLVFQTLFCYVLQDSLELGNGGTWHGRTSRTVHSLFSHRYRTNKTQMWDFWCQAWRRKKKNTFPAETLALHEEDFNNAAMREQRALLWARPPRLASQLSFPLTDVSLRQGIREPWYWSLGSNQSTFVKRLGEHQVPRMTRGAIG